MYIRESNELKSLATAAGKKAAEVEKIIVSELIKHEMIYDDPEIGVVQFSIVSTVMLPFRRL